MSNLTLSVTISGNSLDVSQANNANQMGRGQSGTITWQLTGNAASGTFNAIKTPSPGFAWIQQPPNGVFGQPSLQNNNQWIQMTDNNNNPNGVNSAGEWIYQLFATVGGKQYSTAVGNPISAIKNPKIKNN